MRGLLSKPLLILTFACVLSAQGAAVRIRDISYVLGARENQLVGIGLVYGLANDGDKDPAYTTTSLANTLKTFGIELPREALTSKNVAAVMVTAEIPPFAKSGTRIDITVAAMGDAKSLNGGLLAQTPLRGADGKVYAVAQGALQVGGFSLGTGGAGGANVQKNHPTTAQIVGGALVERVIPATIVSDGQTLDLVLHQSNFSTAARMAEQINNQFPSSSQAIDGSTVRVKIPDTHQTGPVSFISRLEQIEVIPDTPARIIINEKTGTIVATARIKVNACAIAHGNIVLRVSETLDASQPAPFAQVGQTVVTPTTTTQVTEQPGKMQAFPELPTVEKVAHALNGLGVTPRDMMSIFQSLKQSGALQAEVVSR